MSDLYIVLRTRLESVGKRFDWVEVGSKVMRSSRDSLGLSREAVARAMNLSAKTYERYEKTGLVPRHELKKLATVLELEVEEAPARRVVTVDAREESLPLEAVAVQIAEAAGQVAEQAEKIAEASERMEALLVQLTEQARHPKQDVQ